MVPPFISARSNVKMLIFSGSKYFVREYKLWTQLPELGYPKKIVGLFQAKLFLALIPNFKVYQYVNSCYLVICRCFCTFLVTLEFQAVFRHDIFRLILYKYLPRNVLGKVNNFQCRSGVSFFEI